MFHSKIKRKVWLKNTLYSLEPYDIIWEPSFLFRYDTNLQDMSRKFANVGKFPAEWQIMHFTVSDYTAKWVHIILWHCCLSWAKASYLYTYRVLGEQLVEWRSSPYCKFPLSFSVFQHTLLAGLMAKMPTGSLVCDTRPWRGSLVILPYCWLPPTEAF